MPEKEKIPPNESGMCPHNNFSDSCEQCKEDSDASPAEQSTNTGQEARDENWRRILELRLSEANEKLDKALESKVPIDKNERDHTTTEEDGATIVEQKPTLERMKLDIRAGIEHIRDTLGTSDFAQASKEVDAIEKQIRELEE